MKDERLSRIFRAINFTQNPNLFPSGETDARWCDRLCAFHGITCSNSPLENVVTPSCAQKRLK